MRNLRMDVLSKGEGRPASHFHDRCVTVSMKFKRHGAASSEGVGPDQVGVNASFLKFQCGHRPSYHVDDVFGLD